MVKQREHKGHKGYTKSLLSYQGAELGFKAINGATLPPQPGTILEAKRMEWQTWLGFPLLRW